MCSSVLGPKPSQLSGPDAATMQPGGKWTNVSLPWGGLPDFPTIPKMPPPHIGMAISGQEKCIGFGSWCQFRWPTLELLLLLKRYFCSIAKWALFASAAPASVDLTSCWLSTPAATHRLFLNRWEQDWQAIINGVAQLHLPYQRKAWWAGEQAGLEVSTSGGGQEGGSIASAPAASAFYCTSLLSLLSCCIPASTSTSEAKSNPARLFTFSLFSLYRGQWLQEWKEDSWLGWSSQLLHLYRQQLQGQRWHCHALATTNLCLPVHLTDRQHSSSSSSSGCHWPVHSK